MWGKAAGVIKQVHYGSKEGFPLKDRWAYWGKRNEGRG